MNGYQTQCENKECEDIVSWGNSRAESADDKEGKKERGG